MNAVIAEKSLRHLCPDLNRPSLQIQRNVPPGTRATRRANERPDLATSSGNEFRQFVWLHAASDYGGGNRLRIRQFDLVGHTADGLTPRGTMAADSKRPNPRTGAARRHSLNRKVGPLSQTCHVCGLHRKQWCRCSRDARAPCSVERPCW